MSRDTVGVGRGNLPPVSGFTAPNGAVNVTDIQAFVLTAQGSSSPSAATTWLDLHGLGEGNPPNFIPNVAEVQRIKFGFEGQRYTDAPGHRLPTGRP